LKPKKERAGVDLRLEQAREEEDYRIKPDCCRSSRIRAEKKWEKGIKRHTPLGSPRRLFGFFLSPQESLNIFNMSPLAPKIS
jgi:hypothetical protein